MRRALTATGPAKEDRTRTQPERRAPPSALTGKEPADERDDRPLSGTDCGVHARESGRAAHRRRSGPDGDVLQVPLQPGLPADDRPVAGPLPVRAADRGG